MKLRVALDIIGKEVGKLQGASPAFYIALGYLLAHTEHEVRREPVEVSDRTELIHLTDELSLEK